MKTVMPLILFNTITYAFVISDAFPTVLSNRYSYTILYHMRVPICYAELDARVEAFAYFAVLYGKHFRHESHSLSLSQPIYRGTRLSIELKRVQTYHLCVSMSMPQHIALDTCLMASQAITTIVNKGHGGLELWALGDRLQKLCSATTISPSQAEEALRLCAVALHWISVKS